MNRLLFEKTVRWFVFERGLVIELINFLSVKNEKCIEIPHNIPEDAVYKIIITYIGKMPPFLKLTNYA